MQFRTQLEPKPKGWQGKIWPGRKPGRYQWFEIQDSTDYWEEFNTPKIIYPEITWRPEWAFDTHGMYASNTVYFVATSDLWILSVANSPVSWWYAWRTAVHGKDEACDTSANSFSNCLYRIHLVISERKRKGRNRQSALR